MMPHVSRIVFNTAIFGTYLFGVITLLVSLCDHFFGPRSGRGSYLMLAKIILGVPCGLLIQLFRLTYSSSYFMKVLSIMNEIRVDHKRCTFVFCILCSMWC
jgi:hypothetical protein